MKEYYDNSELIKFTGTKLKKQDYMMRTLYHLVVSADNKDFNKELTKWVKIDNTGRPYLVLGYTYYKMDNIPKSLKMYDKALKIDTSLAPAWYNKACTYAILEEKENMLANLKHAISLNEEFKEKAKTDDDFLKYKDYQDFQAILS